MIPIEARSDRKRQSQILCEILTSKQAATLRPPNQTVIVVDKETRDRIIDVAVPEDHKIKMKGIDKFK